MYRFFTPPTKEELEEKSKQYHTLYNTGEKPIKLTEEEINDLLMYGESKIIINKLVTKRGSEQWEKEK